MPEQQRGNGRAGFGRLRPPRETRTARTDSLHATFGSTSGRGALVMTGRTIAAKCETGDRDQDRSPSHHGAGECDLRHSSMTTRPCRTMVDRPLPAIGAGGDPFELVGGLEDGRRSVTRDRRVPGAKSDGGYSDEHGEGDQGDDDDHAVEIGVTLPAAWPLRQLFRWSPHQHGRTIGRSRRGRGVSTRRAGR